MEKKKEEKEGGIEKRIEEGREEGEGGIKKGERGKERERNRVLNNSIKLLDESNLCLDFPIVCVSKSPLLFKAV